MKRNLINFTTAKLAKRLEFDDNDSGFYYPLKETTKGIDGKVGIGELSLIDCAGSEFFKADNFALAPTQSALQKWIREVLMINIIVDAITTNKWLYKLMAIDDEKMHKHATIYKSESSYKTYEDALEIGLQDALKLTLL